MIIIKKVDEKKEVVVEGGEGCYVFTSDLDVVAESLKYQFGRVLHKAFSERDKEEEKGGGA